MYQPYELSKIKDRILKRKSHPKTLVVFFFILNFVFGYDFGFIKMLNQKFQPLAKILSLTITILCIFIFGTPFKSFVGDFFWYTFNFCKYVSYISVIWMTKYTFYDFTLAIYSVDRNIAQINRERIGVVIWVYFLISYISKYVIFYYSCVLMPGECDGLFIPTYIFAIPAVGTDFASVVLILTYYYIYCCVKYLNDLLKDNTKIQILKIRYMSIAECYENIKPFYNKMIVCQLLFEIPKMMSLMWRMLRSIKEERGWFACVGEYVFAFNIMLNIVNSAFAVQMVGSHVDALMLKLHKILVDEPDIKKREEISLLLQHMSARRLQYDIISFIPTDMRLPASVFSLCVTYLIVIVQFTHLY